MNGYRIITPAGDEHTTYVRIYAAALLREYPGSLVTIVDEHGQSAEERAVELTVGDIINLFKKAS